MSLSRILLFVIALICTSALFVYATTNENSFLNALHREQLQFTTTVDNITGEERPVNLSPNTSLQGEIIPKADYGFNLQTAKAYARLSAAAYCAPFAVAQTKTRLTSWTCQSCIDSGLKLTNVSPFRIALGDLYGYAGYNPATNQIVLVFTGSRSIANWITNLNAEFIDFPGVANAQVHKGFYTQWVAARPMLVSILDSLLWTHPNAGLSITGHSLGGAVATMATVDMLTASYEMYDIMGIKYIRGNNAFDDKNMNSMENQLLLNNRHLAKSIPLRNVKYSVGSATYSFGSPRVGNNAFANWAAAQYGNHQFFRITHYQDIVPHLPPIALWKTAQHVMSEVYFGATDINTYTMCDTTPEDKRCSNQHLLPMSVDNHLDYLGYHMGTEESWC